jgi:hypothetical protein
MVRGVYRSEVGFNVLKLLKQRVLRSSFPADLIVQYLGPDMGRGRFLQTLVSPTSKRPYLLGDLLNWLTTFCCKLAVILLAQNATVGVKFCSND